MTDISSTLKLIRKEVREARKAKGLSQEDLANMIGAKQPMISRFETGKGSKLTLIKLMMLATALSMKLEIKLVKDDDGSVQDSRD